MQFTPQQLSGGPKFSSSTRIGNWQEEVSLDEAKLMDFRKKSNKGNLAIRVLENKMSICTQKVGHTFSEDGSIRFGDVIMLQHDGSGHYLACDPYEDFLPGCDKFFVSCSNSSAATARSTFRVTRPPANLQNIDSDPNDNVLRVGQAFSLMCNEALLIKADTKLMAPPLYLCSTKKNERNATKTTNRQLVFMSPTNDADCVWFVATPSQGRSNASERYLNNGRPVSITDQILITHRQTNCCLICDAKQRDHTDFGVELECYADRTNQFGKLGLVVSEFKGTSTPYTLSKPDAVHYFWHLVTANASAGNANETGSISTMSKGNGNYNTQSIANPPSNDELLMEIQAIIRSKGIDGYWNLRAFYLGADNEFDGKIDRGDLKDGLIGWGISINQRYLDRVIDLVDTKRTNAVIDFPTFMRLLRGDIPKNRLALMHAVWNKLDTYNAGSIPAEDLKKFFNSSEHPLVALGSASHDTVWKQFRLLCKNRAHNAVTNVNIKAKVIAVTKAEFVEYYSDLSAGLSGGPDADADDYFERVITSNWNC